MILTCVWMIWLQGCFAENRLIILNMLIHLLQWWFVKLLLNKRCPSMRFIIPPPPPPGPSVFVSIRHNLDPTEPGSWPRPLSPPFPQKKRKQIYRAAPPKKHPSSRNKPALSFVPLSWKLLGSSWLLTRANARRPPPQLPPPLRIGSQKAKMFTDRLMKGRPCWFNLDECSAQVFSITTISAAHRRPAAAALMHY